MSYSFHMLKRVFMSNNVGNRHADKEAFLGQYNQNERNAVSLTPI